VPYHLYHCDKSRGYKNYNNASIKNINASCEDISKYSVRTRSYKNDGDLLSLLVKNNIKKLVSVEISLCHPGILKTLSSKGIKTFSILYLTDAFWTSKRYSYEGITKTYFCSTFLMNKALKFANVSYDSTKYKCLGNPLFDQLMGVSSGSDVLVMLPNIRKEHVPHAFGDKNNFINIIKSLASKRDLIFKTRQKQWLPNEIKQYAKEIIVDGDKMYPSAIVGAFNKCDTVVMFYSSGIYECVMAGKYVININIPHSRWPWDKAKMREYFSNEEGSPYQYSGVVNSILQTDVTKLSFRCKLDANKRQEWLNKFLGPLTYNSSIEIAKDILRS